MFNRAATSGSAIERPRSVAEVPRAVVRVADLALYAGALVAAGHIGLALWQHRSHVVVAVLAGLVIGCLAARSLSPLRRAQVGLMAFALLVIFHGYELYKLVERPRAATSAWLAGRPWDQRQLVDVWQDERALGRDAWPSVRPRLVYKWRRRSLQIEGREMLPLGGISSVPTVFGNESGEWSTFVADEHGFNNPPGLWTAPLDLVLIGDSFTQGAYVRPEAGVAPVIRRARPSTLSLGMLGNGPLIELATIAEYVPILRPRQVLWLYFRNDLPDLELERTSPLLMKYVDDPSYSQRLADSQPAIDGTLRKAVLAMEGKNDRWPAALSKVGLTRRSRTPVWLQDLVMRKRDSSWSAVLRLDHLYDGLGVGGDPEIKGLPGEPALFRRVLERARSIVDAAGGQLVFVYLPDLWPLAGRDLDHPERARVLDTVRALGLPLVDVHAALRARSDVRTLVPFPEAHFNEAGYELVAKTILEGLAKLGAN